MKDGERPRRHWGLRALVLAMVGGLVGVFVAVGALEAFLEGMRGLAAPGGPGLADLMLIAVVGGAACGAVAGLVIWSAWFLVSWWARVRDSHSSPRP